MLSNRACIRRAKRPLILFDYVVHVSTVLITVQLHYVLVSTMLNIRIFLATEYVQYTVIM
jgi:hypothetical protein